ncbi:MAG: hypothetical protein ACI9G1_004762 [Pirellulaceae bacterium]|jgi:hypothetical protein
MGPVWGTRPVSKVAANFKSQADTKSNNEHFVTNSKGKLVSFENKKSLRKRIAVISFLATLLIFSGCGTNIVPMKGKVVFSDDQKVATELEGYYLSFFCVADDTMATANINADGTFEISTFGDLDGLKLGEFRVTINPPVDNNTGEMIEDNLVYDPKYNTFQHTDLTVTVTAETKEIILPLDRVKE